MESRLIYFQRGNLAFDRRDLGEDVGDQLLELTIGGLGESDWVL